MATKKYYEVILPGGQFMVWWLTQQQADEYAGFGYPVKPLVFATPERIEALEGAIGLLFIGGYANEVRILREMLAEIKQGDNHVE